MYNADEGHTVFSQHIVFYYRISSCNLPMTNTHLGVALGDRSPSFHQEPRDFEIATTESVMERCHALT